MKCPNCDNDDTSKIRLETEIVPHTGGLTLKAAEFHTMICELCEYSWTQNYLSKMSPDDDIKKIWRPMDKPLAVEEIERLRGE